MKYLEAAEFQKQMTEKTDAIEKILRDFLPKEDSFQKTIFQAMDYSLMAGGKRLRPMLMQEAYYLFGNGQEEVLRYFMAAIEMIHTYSLVHDDLPAMDNDDYRRGKKTTHKMFGEDMGILAGDALLNYAYETALKGALKATDKDAALKAVQILAEKAGIYGMVGGQVVDVEMTGKALNTEQIDFIYRLKTSALLEAALMAGAVLGGADEKEVACMEEIGRNVGMAFQIQDDILDITATTEELGKPAHSDEKNEKTTYVTIYGLDASVKAVEEYSDKALATLESMPKQNLYLNTLIQKLVHRKK
ncbi:MAG: farnesyl diphosphate synthase [Butyribacter sp.]|nr:polyprenyl synthetase family protein [bacterium]MDY3854361.1 farnesyl diphosphate synthase [Butyribacter sp.]